MSYESNTARIIEICISSTAIATSFICLRLYTRAIVLRSVGREDWFILFAGVCSSNHTGGIFQLRPTIRSQLWAALLYQLYVGIMPAPVSPLVNWCFRDEIWSGSSCLDCARFRRRAESKGRHAIKVLLYIKLNVFSFCTPLSSSTTPPRFSSRSHYFSNTYASSRPHEWNEYAT